MNASSGGLDFEHLASLLKSAQNGDREALNGLIEILTPLLWHVARAQGIDRDSASDVVQTAWLNLLGSLQEIHSPDGLTAWLITVTKRETWRTRTRHQAERPPDDGLFESVSAPGPRPDEEAVTADQRRRLWAAVNRLPERCRTLLRIVAFVHRPDYEEIGSALGIKRGSVGPTRSRCLTRLKQILTTSPGEEWR
ncbi:RNA polymerase sigma factor [Amycolatopsis umgeniensis]|uniref:RNA polymerase sigma factor (Sigma-70 family) n=1 Tax=Amycolatopsis umgeniensis TaxID=336628 RepID=A0A841AW36_9PSEU|nr:sigma-70 family RNA polymerase sigma factor [Amycolatopsis umgeniensis]MBB5850572.1 RNA polymerase sigma factor (sigma-70 family) [Amycolatopsis umgeniensis]